MRQESDDITPTARARMKLPARLGGCGVRSHVEVAPAAYVGMVIRAWPRVVGASSECGLPIFPSLARDLFWGKQSRPPYIAKSGERKLHGVEGVFQLFQCEQSLTIIKAARECWDTLQERVKADGTAFTKEVALMEGSQQFFTALVEEQVSSSLRSSLQAAHRSRHVPKTQSLCSEELMAFLSVDALSSIWVTQCPDYIGRLNDVEFMTTVADYLALPVPYCKPYVGRPLPAATIERSRLKIADLRGLAFRNARVQGDGWRRCHDAALTTLVAILKDAGVDVEREPSRLFDAALPGVDPRCIAPTEAVGKITPDFLLDLPEVQNDEGETLCEACVILGELKMIHGGSPYDLCVKKPMHRLYAVENRSHKIRKAYFTAASTLDAKFSDASPGPFTKHLQALGDIWGLVSGVYGESNGNLRKLLDYAAHLTPSTSDASAFAVVKHSYYRRFANTVYRAKAGLLSRRLYLVKPNAAANDARMASSSHSSSASVDDAFLSWDLRHGRRLFSAS